MCVCVCVSTYLLDGSVRLTSIVGARGNEGGEMFRHRDAGCELRCQLRLGAYIHDMFHKLVDVDVMTPLQSGKLATNVRCRRRPLQHKAARFVRLDADSFRHELIERMARALDALQRHLQTLDGCCPLPCHRHSLAIAKQRCERNWKRLAYGRQGSRKCWPTGDRLECQLSNVSVNAGFLSAADALCSGATRSASAMIAACCCRPIHQRWRFVEQRAEGCAIVFPRALRRGTAFSLPCRCLIFAKLVFSSPDAALSRTTLSAVAKTRAWSTLAPTH